MQGASRSNPTYTIVGLQIKAEQYVRSQWKKETSTWNMGPIIAVEFNRGLEDGCPALQKYCSGYQSLGLKDLTLNAMFAWHGTPSLQNIASICHHGFNPDTRKRQRYGTGEYFGITASDSHNFTGKTDRLILVQILKCSRVSSNVPKGCLLVNNPKAKNRSFVLPVLVVAYRNGAPLSIPWISGPKSDIPHPFSATIVGVHTWCWTRNNGCSEPFDANVNDLLERSYQSFLLGGPSTITIGPIRRYSDRKTQSYVIDFAKWTQKNSGTGFVRRIERKTEGKRQLWYLKEDGNVSKPYPSAVSDALEGHYQAYIGSDGASKIRASHANGLSYIIDFGNMTQTNEITGFERAIERGDVLSLVGLQGQQHRWQWTMNDGTLEPYPQEVSDTIEEHYQKFSQGGPRSFATGGIIRLCDRATQSYTINFLYMVQFNMKTGYVRPVRRLRHSCKTVAGGGDVNADSTNIKKL